MKILNSTRQVAHCPSYRHQSAPGTRRPQSTFVHNGFRGLSRRSGAGYLVCMDTVLCAGNTAFVLACPLRAGEFATKMAPAVALRP
jgi:hypothetical protein